MTIDNELFSGLDAPVSKKKKHPIDDRRNILILELPGTKQGEQELKKIWEELRDRGYICKIME